MRLDVINIAAPPEAIWPFVADPVLMSTWNPKIVAVDRSLEGDVRVGERYEMIYVMSGRERESSVEVIEVEPFTRIVYRQTFKMGDELRYADEIYDLTARGENTRLELNVDLTHSGMPRMFRWIAAFITRFGKSVGEPYFEVLKRTVEEADVREAA